LTTVHWLDEIGAPRASDGLCLFPGKQKGAYFAALLNKVGSYQQVQRQSQEDIQKRSWAEFTARKLTTNHTQISLKH
jgi:hypothetical protein